ncbi:MAG: hypothetical protein BGO37_08430 [Cellulomonas sp. 73-92]|uniref:hypothetical protein n=1 Tax=Cellulomonas sp. 73-92 TaxID=1895740 RepID=UPI00092996C0|nr:hypothetical protein [Cellulomonas sp. 73-92]OJV84433.1 MAG: hypothetical protein BGO37_08430 [Cellulomonas sp. 73-92]
MSTLLVWVGVVLSLVLAASAGWHTLRNRPVILRQLLAGAVVEAYLLIQLVVVLVHPAGGGAASGLFWTYVVTQLFVLPLAATWAFAERTRWSSVVLLLGALVVAFLQLRLLQVWGQA